MSSAQKIHEVFPALSPPSDEARAKAHKLACELLDHAGEGMPRVRGVGRDIVVAMFHELGARLERGEIDGARLQWLDTHGGCISKHEDKAVVSGVEFVVREPNGVRLVPVEVIEDAHNAPPARHLSVVSAEEV